MHIKIRLFFSPAPPPPNPPTPLVQSNQKSFELQLLEWHATLQARVCACAFEAGGGSIGVGVVCVRERGDSPFWQNHVIVKQRDKEALFTIWSPFWS